MKWKMKKETNIEVRLIETNLFLGKKYFLEIKRRLFI